MSAADAPQSASVEALVSRLPADLHGQLRALRPPLASINAIECFVESLSARARELDDEGLLRAAAELHEAADVFDLPLLSARLNALRESAERPADAAGSTPS